MKTKRTVLCWAILIQAFATYAYGMECFHIHAPTGVIDTDSSTTASYAVTHQGVRLTSPGTLTVRYPLPNIDEFNSANLHLTTLGFTDSYSDAKIKVELIQQKIEPVYNRFIRVPSVSTQRFTLIDTNEFGDSAGYRRESNWTGPTLNTDDYVYSLEVTLQKDASFPSRVFYGSGVEINNLSFCPYWING